MRYSHGTSYREFPRFGRLDMERDFVPGFEVVHLVVQFWNMNRTHTSGNRIFYVDDDIVTFPSFHVHVLRKSRGCVGEENGLNSIGIAI